MKISFEDSFSINNKVSFTVPVHSTNLFFIFCNCFVSSTRGCTQVMAMFSSTSSKWPIVKKKKNLKRLLRNYSKSFKPLSNLMDIAFITNLSTESLEIWSALATSTKLNVLFSDGRTKKSSINASKWIFSSNTTLLFISTVCWSVWKNTKKLGNHDLEFFLFTCSASWGLYLLTRFL